MEALAAGRLDEAGEDEVGEPLAHVQRGRDHIGEGQALVRIEIEDHAVGAVERIERHAPRVDFQRTHLHHRDQARKILDIEIGLVEARHFDLAKLRQHARTGMPLIEAFLLSPRRATHHRHGAAGDMRQHPLGHSNIMVGKLRFRDPLLRPKHFVRVRKPDPLHDPLLRHPAPANVEASSAGRASCSS